MCDILYAAVFSSWDSPSWHYLLSLSFSIWKLNCFRFSVWNFSLTNSSPLAYKIDIFLTISIILQANVTSWMIAPLTLLFYSRSSSPPASPKPLPSKNTAPVASSSSSVPRKLVRGQDVWLGKGQEQTRQILKCMWCGQSFPSLADLTVHMQVINLQPGDWTFQGDILFIKKRCFLKKKFFLSSVFLRL